MDCEGKHCSNQHLYLGEEWAPQDGLTGENYPYKYKNGKPFIPYAFYGNSDGGQFWDLAGRRGARAGALNMIALSTFGLRSAFGAAVPPIFCVDLVKPAGNQRGLQQGTQLGDPGSSDSLAVVPGSMLFLQSSPDGKNPQIQVAQTSANLQALQQYIAGYAASQLANQGLASDQVLNTSQANPTSAGALAITASAKRQIAAMVAPYFRRCDLAAVKMAAALARIGGVADWPEDGWSISYSQIPLSPQEQQAIRDEETHEKGLGLVSTVDLWLRRHPGQTRAEAVAHLLRVQAEEAALSAGLSGAPETPEAGKMEPPEDTSEASQEVTGEMPEEDDTSEEIEDEAVSEAQEELQAILDALSYDGEADISAIRASVENIRDSLAKIHG